MNLSNEVVAQLVEKCYKRLRQEFEAHQDEFFDKSIREHSAIVNRISWKTAQSWSKWDNDGPILMPDSTRIYYRKGNVEVILQEFQPQIRLLRFVGDLAVRSSTDETLSKDVSHKPYGYSLALPYVNFMFKFVDGMFNKVHCYFSDRPLKNLDEKPLKPYFSNLDNTLKICLGNSFDKSKLIKDQLAQQSAYILDYFWSSLFTDEWAQNFWSCKQHFISADQRLASLDKWEAASIENPLFVVEDVNWLPHGEESFGDIITSMFDDDNVSPRLQDELYQELSSQFTENISKAYIQMMDDINDKVLSKVAESLVKELEAEANTSTESV